MSGQVVTGLVAGRLAVAALALAVLASSCSGDAGDASPAGGAAASTTTATAATGVAAVGSPGCRSGAVAPDAPGTHERVDLDVDGTSRWYTRLVPAASDTTAADTADTGTAPLPLVVDLHGYLSGSAGQAAISDFATLAEREGFVVVTPQGNGDLPYWNAVPHADLPDDVGFVEAVIDHVGATTCIDPARVYVDGFSNGAFLTSLVACRLADRVAAVAAVAGLQVPADCAPARPVPVLAIHGTDDEYVSFAGGPNPALAELTWDDASRRAFEGLPFADVTVAAATWAGLAGCEPEPTRTEVAPDVERATYAGCDGAASVELYVVEGGGHTWPASAFTAASASILGPTSDGIDATELIWSFFAAHPMPGDPPS